MEKMCMSCQKRKAIKKVGVRHLCQTCIDGRARAVGGGKEYSSIKAAVT